eukprot:447022-Amphidinium_carterae.2
MKERKKKSNLFRQSDSYKWIMQQQLCCPSLAAASKLAPAKKAQRGVSSGSSVRARLPCYM